MVKEENYMYNNLTISDFRSLHTNNPQVSDRILEGLSKESLIESRYIDNEKGPNFSVVSTCPDSERYLFNKLDSSSKYYRRGCILTLEDTPLGYVQLSDNRVFLSWRSVKNENKYTLVFGGLYAIPRILLEEINAVYAKSGAWNFKEVKQLSFMPLRMIVEDFRFPLRDKMRKERDLVEKMLSYLSKHPLN